jgi:hypothetical protein
MLYVLVCYFKILENISTSENYFILPIFLLNKIFILLIFYKIRHYKVHLFFTWQDDIRGI